MLEQIRSNFERIIALYETEKQRADMLSAQLQSAQASNEAYKKHITELERQIDDLKLAEAFLATGDSHTEAKERITKLIKEIDRCISLMEK